jgi:hypothetical protein
MKRKFEDYTIQTPLARREFTSASPGAPMGPLQELHGGDTNPEEMGNPQPHSSVLPVKRKASTSLLSYNKVANHFKTRSFVQ